MPLHQLIIVTQPKSPPDPEFALDPDLINARCHNVSLHYTFFNTNDKQSRFDMTEIMANVKSVITGKLLTLSD